MSHSTPENAQWIAEVPTVDLVPEKYGENRPHVVLTAGAPWEGFQLDVALAPSRTGEVRSRDSVRVPYIGNDPQEGLAHNLVAVSNIYAGPDKNNANAEMQTDIEIADPARELLTNFWANKNVHAVFCDEDIARDAGAVALVEIERGFVDFPVQVGRFRKKMYNYAMTSSGLVLASMRAVVQAVFDGRYPSPR